MVNYFTIAERYVEDNIGVEYAIVPERILETEAFFCFSYQSKKYLQTGDLGHMAVGQGPMLLSKADERLFEYGSAFTREQAMADLEIQLEREKKVRAQFPEFDFRDSYNLTITSIHLPELLRDAFLTQGMNYIIPEVVGEDIFRIPKPYTKQQLEERLRELPATFHHKTGQWISIFYQENAIKGLCEMEIAPYRKTERAKNILRTTEADLKPIW